MPPVCLHDFWAWVPLLWPGKEYERAHRGTSKLYNRRLGHARLRQASRPLQELVVVE
jgi:hypothetical protein